jgi:hypothetical protein
MITLRKLNKAANLHHKLKEVNKEIKVFQQWAETLSESNDKEICFNIFAEMVEQEQPMVNNPMPEFGEGEVMMMVGTDPNALKQMMQSGMIGAGMPFPMPMKRKKQDGEPHMHIHINNKEMLHVLAALLKVKQEVRREIIVELNTLGVKA